MSTKKSRTERINNIEEIRHEILGMHLSRLIIFSDVINRYLHLRLKEYENWVKVNTILFLITRQENLTPSQLANLMLRSRNTITKLINGLESNGLIKRGHSSKDHRIVILEVTSKGLEFTMNHLKKLSPLDEEVRACLNDDELSMLVVLTRKLRLKLIENITGLKSPALRIENERFSKAV